MFLDGCGRRPQKPPHCFRFEASNETNLLVKCEILRCFVVFPPLEQIQGSGAAVATQDAAGSVSRQGEGSVRTGTSSVLHTPRYCEAYQRGYCSESRADEVRSTHREDLFVWTLT